MAQHILIFGIRLYRRTLSPLLAALSGPFGRCRFEPSCSQYAMEAVRVHGALKGGALAVWRICRCQPWGGCGDDPVPPKKSKNAGDAQAHTCAPTKNCNHRAELELCAPRF